jgi:hypothetical protein
MGFFDALGKIVKGEPVFTPGQPDGKQQTTNSAFNQAPPAPAGATPPVAPAGPKEYPRLELGRVQCRMSGDDMEVEVEVKNESSQQLDLDQVRMLGKGHDMGTMLRPGEEREFTLYEGDRPRSTGNSRIEISFRTVPGGDYFQAEFVADFKQESDGTYTVQRFRFIQVRDI